MNYEEVESSVEEAAPYELYEFRRGSEFWRYTSAPIDIIRDNNVYLPEYIQRDDIKQVDDISKGGIKLKVPRTNSLGLSLLQYAPEAVITVTISRAHFSSDTEEYVTYWRGRILTVSAADSTITLSCESIFSSLRRAGLRARFEISCRHSLYSKACTLSLGNFISTATVIGVAGVELVIPDAEAKPDGYFIGGIIQSELGSLRLITNHVGSAISINRVFNETIGATEVLLYPGCDRARTTCKNKFNNLLNFGGFSWIPSRNPFSGSLI